MLSEYKQHPQVLPRGGAATVLLPVQSGAKPPPVTPSALRLHIQGVPPQQATAHYAQLQRITPVTDPDAPVDLIWNVSQTGTMINQVCDVLAYLSENTPPAVQRVIDKWTLMKTVQALSEARSLQLRLHPGDMLHHEGREVRVNIDGQQYPYFTLFNLSADGTVQFLYPQQAMGDALQISLGQPFHLPLRVTPPFGAEHLVAVASQRPLQGLHTVLQQLHGTSKAAILEEALQQHLNGHTYQMGVLGVYTKARER